MLRDGSLLRWSLLALTTGLTLVGVGHLLNPKD